MNSIQEQTIHRELHPGDLVLWHERTNAHVEPVPGVVLCQENDEVVIRIYRHGASKQITLKRDELSER